MTVKSNHKHINILICGTIYEITLYLSFNDIIYLIDCQKDANIGNSTIIATMLKSHIIPNDKEISIEEIQSDNNALDSFVIALINENHTLRISYEKFPDEHNLQQRFIMAAHDMNHEMAKQMAESVDTLISSITNPLLSISKQIGDMVIGISNQLKSIFEKFKIPTISNERKETLRMSFATWGKYGWTILPSANLNIFENVPQTQEEANKIAHTYCDKKSLLNLFSLTKNTKGVKISDYEEAIFDFENRKYKSCTMILLSLIDAKLIRMQRNEDRNAKGKRKSGLGAIEKIKTRIEKEQDIDTKLLFVLSYTNLFACLEIIFANGDDFKIQPALPNRNFVNHGMLTRKARRRDCIQLFLLYYNFLEFFEMINV